jgi:predicted RNA binding protein YcfA (HicA-like mRNA interferase family)
VGAMEARHLLRALKDEGWYLGESSGASRQYVHGNRPGHITVCVRYTDELGPDTLASLSPVREPGAEPARPAGPDAGSGHAMELERTSSGYSAYSPDLPGCVATGETEAEVRLRMAEAITLHRTRLPGH